MHWEDVGKCWKRVENGAGEMDDELSLVYRVNISTFVDKSVIQTLQAAADTYTFSADDMSTMEYKLTTETCGASSVIILNPESEAPLYWIPVWVEIAPMTKHGYCHGPKSGPKWAVDDGGKRSNDVASCARVMKPPWMGSHMALATSSKDEKLDGMDVFALCGCRRAMGLGGSEEEEVCTAASQVRTQPAATHRAVSGDRPADSDRLADRLADRRIDRLTGIG